MNCLQLFFLFKDEETASLRKVALLVKLVASENRECDKVTENDWTPLPLSGKLKLVYVVVVVVVFAMEVGRNVSKSGFHDSSSKVCSILLSTREPC